MKHRARGECSERFAGKLAVRSSQEVTMPYHFGQRMEKRITMAEVSEIALHHLDDLASKSKGVDEENLSNVFYN
jgi:hypothetical protein